MLTLGIKGHAALRVTTENTALAMGSGELPVLATPAVAALIERACWQSVAAELELDQGTVGTALTLAHTAPTPVGMVVHCDCELTAVEAGTLRPHALGGALGAPTVGRSGRAARRRSFCR